MSITQEDIDLLHERADHALSRLEQITERLIELLHSMATSQDDTHGTARASSGHYDRANLVEGESHASE